MTKSTSLFVQAFWVCCRETIRPELDVTVDRLKHAGHDAHVATQEASDEPDGLPNAGPALILSVHPHRGSERQTLRFGGDVARHDVVISSSKGRTVHHAMDSLELPVVKAEIAAFVTDLLGPRP
ncbi:MAG: hypothetical protein U1E23_04545 [Reyranellaceae bacterium]